MCRQWNGRHKDVRRYARSAQCIGEKERRQARPCGQMMSSSLKLRETSLQRDSGRGRGQVLGVKGVGRGEEILGLGKDFDVRDAGLE